MVNLTTRGLAFATDYCGVKSGRDTDKFRDMKLHLLPGEVVKAPLLEESPVNIECCVKQILRLGSHDMFLAQVAAVHAQEAYMDSKGRFRLDKAQPIAYSHGGYYLLGEKLGTFGYSVRK